LLPFANISSDREQEYFADGMVKEIITALQWPRSPRSHPKNPHFSNSVSGLCPSMFPRYRDTRGMDHVRLHPTRTKPARQPRSRRGQLRRQAQSA
jgi:hypothetical protein